LFFRETAIIFDGKLDVVSRKFQIAHMIARKIVHQYIGNLISQPSWSYLWLNEGIASFLAMKIVNQVVFLYKFSVRLWIKSKTNW